MGKVNYYAIIPANVRYDENLKANAKLLYGEITALANKEGYCWAGNSYFSELYDVKPETVSRWISDLVKHGYLIRQVIKGDNGQVKERRLYINDLLIKESRGVDQKVKGVLIKESRGVDQKVKGNNTTNNTLNNTTNGAQTFSDENICLSGKPDASPKNCPHKKIISYLNDKANKSFSYKTEVHREQMKNRWDEGYTLEDFYTVIENMTAIWLGDPYWETYLNPQTLFRPSKFGKYLHMTNHQIHKEAYARFRREEDKENKKYKQSIERGKDEYADLF